MMKLLPSLCLSLARSCPPPLPKSVIMVQTLKETLKLWAAGGSHITMFLVRGQGVLSSRWIWTVLLHVVKKKKINCVNFKDLISFIQWFANWAPSNLADIVIEPDPFAQCIARQVLRSRGLQPRKSLFTRQPTEDIGGVSELCLPWCDDSQILQIDIPTCKTCNENKAGLFRAFLGKSLYVPQLLFIEKLLPPRLSSSSK